MEITSSTTVANSPATAATSHKTAASTANFAVSLASAVKLAGKADFVSGRLGVNLNSDGVPSQVAYFDEQGNRLATSDFSAESILRNTRQLGIGLTDLKSLGTQLDAAGVGYKPYELYKGTGSDHGIDFDDLIAGGLGTAYDWTRDANVAAKGRGALGRLEEAGALAKSLNLTTHAEVTQDKGINPSRFTQQTARDGSVLSDVLFNGHFAAWYDSLDQATQASKLYGGTVIKIAAPANSAASSSVAASVGARASSPTLSATATTQAASATGLNTQLEVLIDSLREQNVQQR